MPDCTFPKAGRLLTAADYQPVFTQARFKISSKAVLILAIPNDLNRPRIGLVLAKKNIRLAVQRNRLKRLIRESFRLRQQQLPALDIVILARSGLDTKDNATIYTELSMLWDKLRKQAESTPSPA